MKRTYISCSVVFKGIESSEPEVIDEERPQVMSANGPTTIEGSAFVMNTAETGGAGHIVQLDRSDSFSQVAFEVTGDGARSRRSTALSP